MYTVPPHVHKHTIVRSQPRPPNVPLLFFFFLAALERTRRGGQFLCVFMDTVFVEDAQLASMLYKVVGDENLILEYHQKHNSSLTDWSFLYLQLSKEHAKTATGNRWDQGYRIAKLLAVRLAGAASVSIKRVVGDVMWNGAVDGTTKAALVKQALRLSHDVPLPLQLESRRTLLLVEETQGEWELLVPHGLVAEVLATECVVSEEAVPKWLASCYVMKTCPQ